MAHAISHVIEYRNKIMQRQIWAVFCEHLPRPEEDAKIAAIEAEAGFKHGWFHDEMAGASFQCDGGKGIVWVDQPYSD